MKIAEALLLRKQLAEKVAQLQPLKDVGEKGVFEVRTERKTVSENIDEVKFVMPRITLKEITSEYDHYASELRKLDASIQKANWAFDVDYKESSLKKDK
jgi:hypothetical protein